MMEEIGSLGVLDAAYEWLCRQRRKAPPDSDVWQLRWRWTTIRPELQKALVSGEYRFTAPARVLTECGMIECWSACDALVLKAITLVLSQRLAPHLQASCYNLKGRGGAKAAVRAVAAAASKNTFVFRSDIKSYFASPDHEVVYGILRKYITDQRVLDLLWRYLNRTVYYNGFYNDIRRGIPLGCPLSTLVGVWCLEEIDRQMGSLGLFYARFMDDWVVLAPTRWKLRSAVRAIREIVFKLKLELAPDKTFVGRVSKGFDFLGYQFRPEGVRIAELTLKRFVERVNWLY